MRVRFYIERRKDERGKLLDADRPVFMSVSFHGKRVMLSTGIKVDRHWWDREKQCVREHHPEAVVLNGWLHTMKTTAGATWKALASLSEEPGAEDFRREFQRLRPRFSLGFFDVFYLFMEEGSSRWSPSTYRKVRSVYRQLRDFEATSGSVLSFHRVDRDFLDAFIEYCDRRGMGEVTRLKTVNILVWYLNWATRQGYNIYKEYRDFYGEMRKKMTRGSRRFPYLEWDELMKLYHYATEEPVMDRVRDLFCLMCFTGIRFSELIVLKKEHVEQDRIIVGKPTGKTRFIPVNKFAKHILGKYEQRYYRGNAAFPVMSLVTFHKYLQRLAVEIGLDPEKKITSGVASSTFIMNALRLEIPPEVISSYTGVKSDIRVALMKQELANSEMEKFNLIQHTQNKQHEDGKQYRDHK